MMSSAILHANLGCKSAGGTKGGCGMVGMSRPWGTHFSVPLRREHRMETRSSPPFCERMS